MKKITLKAPLLFFIWAASSLSLSAAGFQETAEVPAAFNKKPIRIGVMPDAGTLPLYLIPGVEPVSFMSARERDTALLTGELDAVTGDLVGLLHFRTNGIKNRMLTITESRFMILAAEDFKESTIWKVGISENTVIEFMVDQLVKKDENIHSLEKISIPRVPVRLEMLRSGKLPMACLTDVMAQSLPSEDFRILKDQRNTDLEPAVLIFSERFLQSRSGEIEAFKASWNRAVEKINTDPDKYRDLLISSVRLPSETSYDVPRFRPVTLPGKNTVDHVLSWYREKYGDSFSDDEWPSYDDLIIK